MSNATIGPEHEYLTDVTLRRILSPEDAEVEMSDIELGQQLGAKLKHIRLMLGRSLRQMEEELAKDGVRMDHSSIKLLEDSDTPNLEQATAYASTLYRIWRDIGEALGYKVKSSSPKR